MTIIRFVWTRRGMTAFQNEVNAQLSQGWIGDYVAFTKAGYFGCRVICYAYFTKAQVANVEATDDCY